MSDPVIAVRNLSKRYVLGHQRSSRDGLRHRLEEFCRAPLRWLRRRRELREETKEEFWALKDLTFDVYEGDVVGIIGRNGAGKSTLLKVLSRITEPSAGLVRLKGRVASLLEVGTGFHQDLTGRENIYLNGAILGMTHAEIRARFDEIVAFSEIEKFLDTPVKRYSSGMYVRLAFAVAAHLEPEILIVDEVLAVGDAEFQKKCLGKMSEVANGGRTVLFVSHNMASLSSLCNRGILLRNGQKEFEGSVAETIAHYLNTGSANVGHYVAAESDEPVRLVDAAITSLMPGGVHVSGTPLKIRLRIRSAYPIKNGCVAIHVMNFLNVSVLHFRAYDRGVFFGNDAGITVLECELPECWLNVGPYHLDVYLADPPGGEIHEVVQGICPFNVEVHHETSWFGWNKEACCYLQRELWTLAAGNDESLQLTPPHHRLESTC